MPTWRAVVFDLDDTLYPEREYVLSGFRAAAAHAASRFGADAGEAYAELEALFRSGVRGDTFSRWLAARGLPEEAMPELVRAYREHEPCIRPFPGVPGLLGTLKDRTRLGLVSDGWHAVQRAKLRALGLEGELHAVVFSDALGRECWKPSPEPFRRVLGELGVDAAHAVYVGDNCAKDFLGARSLGMDTVWARHGEGDHAGRDPRTPAHAAARTTHTFGELADLLLENTS